MRSLQKSIRAPSTLPPENHPKGRVACLGIAAIVYLMIPGCFSRPGPTPDLSPDLARTSDPYTFEAIQAQWDIARDQPQNPKASAALGVLLKESDFPEEARVWLERAVKIEPRQPRWTYLMGWSYLPSQPAQAIAYLEKARMLASGREPDHSICSVRLAEALAGLGNSEAERKVWASVPPDPPYGDLAQLRLAELAWEEGKDQEALDHLARVSPRPGWAPRIERLKRSMPQTGSATRAGAPVSSLVPENETEATWVDPFLAQTRPAREGLKGAFQLASRWEAQGRFRDAVGLFEELTQKTRDPRTRVGFITNLMKIGDWDRARTVLDRSLKEFPETVQLWHLEGGWHLTRGIQLALEQKEDQARVHWLEARAIWSRPALIHQKESREGLCRADFWLEDLAALKQDCKILLNQDPHHEAAKTCLAFLAKESRLPRADALKRWDEGGKGMVGPIPESQVLIPKLKENPALEAKPDPKPKPATGSSPS